MNKIMDWILSQMRLVDTEDEQEDSEQETVAIEKSWILDKKVAPPMLFDELVDVELDEKLRPELNRLLEMKKTLSEMGMAPKVQIFNDYIEKVMPDIKEAAEKIEETEKDCGTCTIACKKHIG